VNDPNPPVAPTTTVEQDLKSAGQRRINNVWEYTQAFISSAVVLTTCAGIFMGSMARTPAEHVAFPPEWWTILGLVIGFYFGRSNHARLGDSTR
jgi:hypothetical protein